MRITPEVRGEHGGALRRAGFEQLDDAGKTVGDVLADDAAGVERPHRELGSRLADGLGGDHADRLAELDAATGRERLAVARGTDAVVGLTGEHRPGTDTVDRRVGGQLLDLEVADDAAGLEDRCRRRA